MALAFKNLLKALSPSTAAFDANFAAGVFDPRITFTRASNATYVNSAGNVATATTNEPRLDYDPVTLACRGLLIEEQRTNLCLHGSNIGLSPWVWPGDTNTTTSPDGSATGGKEIAWDGLGLSKFVYQAATVVASTAYQFSFYVKLGTLPASSFKVAFRDDTAGAFISQDVAPSVTPTSSAWTRVTFSVTTPVGCTSMRVYCFRNTATVTGGTFYLWGAQLEAGSFATSYIPTTGSSATRAADVAVVSGANFSGFYNSAAGTVVWEGVFQRINAPANQYAYSISDGTGSNRVQQFNQTATADVANRFAAGGVSSNPGSAVGVVVASSVWKMGCSFTTGAVLTSYSATSGSSTAPAAMPTVDRLHIGSNETAAAQPNGYIRRLRYYNRALSQAELNALTA